MITADEARKISEQNTPDGKLIKLLNDAIIEEAQKGKRDMHREFLQSDINKRLIRTKFGELGFCVDFYIVPALPFDKDDTCVVIIKW